MKYSCGISPFSLIERDIRVKTLLIKILSTNVPNVLLINQGYQFMFRERMYRSLIPVSYLIKDQRKVHTYPWYVESHQKHR